MSKSIYSAASAMQANGRRIEVIADNIANLSSTGYKRRTTSVGSFEEKVDGKSQAMLRTQARWDFEQGTLVRTGEPYNLALFGQGFFALEGKDGELYTRKGNFHVAEDGAIKTEDDLPLAWESRAGAIDPHGPAVSIGADGSVQQGGEILGRLRIVDFAERQKLAMTENSCFRAPKGVRAGPAQAEVHQGELESSNASAMTEMVELVEAQRAYELAANVMTQNDQSYRRLTRQV